MRNRYLEFFPVPRLDRLIAQKKVVKTWDFISRNNQNYSREIRNKKTKTQLRFCLLKISSFFFSPAPGFNNSNSLPSISVNPRLTVFSNRNRKRNLSFLGFFVLSPGKNMKLLSGLIISFPVKKKTEILSSNHSGRNSGNSSKFWRLRILYFFFYTIIRKFCIDNSFHSFLLLTAL